MVSLARMAAAALAVAAVTAEAQQDNRYEPSARMRLPKEVGCMKDEVANGPACVKKCQADFRLELDAKPPVCIATRTGAKYAPPPPTWKPADKPASSGAKGY